MARARNIKPGFFQNEQLGELDPIDRLFFIGLWTVADYRGCVEFRSKRLKIQLLPWDNCDVENIAINLERSGLIRKYSVQGQTYLKIINFERHQNPHKNERDAGSDLPDITDKLAQVYDSKGLTNNPDKDGTKPDFIGTTRADPLLLIPDSLIPITDSCSLIPETLPSEKKPSRKATPSADDSVLQEVCRKTWAAFSSAYFERYGTEPVRNAKVNANVKNFVKRIPAEEAPEVARFFVGHNDSFYVRKMHDFGLLLADSEKVRTEWATNRTVTATKARQLEKSSGMYDAVSEILAERGMQ